MNLIKSIWPAVPTVTQISIADTIKYQENKFTFLADLIKAKIKAARLDAHLFKSASDFAISDAKQAIIIAQINEKKQYQHKSIYTCIDSDSFFEVEYNNEETSFETFNVQAKDLVPGIVAGIHLRKAKKAPFKNTLLNLSHRIGIGKQYYVAKQFILPGIRSQQNFSKPGAKCVFISDVHVGSKVFLEIAFLNLIKYLNENKDIDVLIITGDICDGTAVYPGQVHDLAINSYSEQYSRLAVYLQGLRKDIALVLIPGNHDLPRREPQQFDLDSKNIAKLKDAHPNTYIFSNPAYISIGEYKLLLYHGASFDSLIAQCEDLTYSQPTKVCQRLLQYRNLCPSTNKVPVLPTEHLYHMIPEDIDVFAAGHIHKLGYVFDKNRLIISSATWQSLTGFQDYVGLVPDYGKAIIHQLGSKHVDIISFIADTDEVRSYKAVV